MDEKERQYQEYLALRQHEQEKEMEKEYFSQPDDKYGQAFPDESKVRHSRRISVTETPYGSSEMRKAQKEKQRRDREMQEYLAAREADRDRRGVRSGIVHTDYDEYGTHRGGRRRHTAPKAPKPRRTGKRRVPAPLIAFMAALVLAIVIGIGGGAVVLAIVGSAEHIPIDKNDIGIDSGAAASIDGYRNILGNSDAINVCTIMT